MSVSVSVPWNSSLSAWQAERGSRPTRRHPREETAVVEFNVIPADSGLDGILIVGDEDRFGVQWVYRVVSKDEPLWCLSYGVRDA